MNNRTADVPRAVVSVRVKPGSSRTVVAGRYSGPNGDALIVAVTARAIDGKATEAVLVALASALGVRPRQVTLIAGATARDKRIAISDPPLDLHDRIAALMDR